MWKCDEKRDRFRRDALAAWTNYQTTGLYATAEEADAWLVQTRRGRGSRSSDVKRALEYLKDFR
jgi:hypothetical protein